MNRLTAILTLVARLSFCVSLFVVVQNVQARSTLNPSNPSSDLYSGYEQEAQKLAQNWLYADQ